VKIRLNPEWSLLLERYKGEHQDRRNQLTHFVGIPMIVASLPLAVTIVGLPVAVGLFTVGWGFQFAGHWFEGNDPAFFGDRRNLVVGVIWWAQKAGLVQLEHESATA
jgi:uncharacterized membrane protein YGL010W